MKKRILSLVTALALLCAGGCFPALAASFEHPTGRRPKLQATQTEASLPLADLVIGIDPGHQSHANSEKEPVAPGSSETKAKVSSGTQGVSTRVPEYEVNLQVALLLRDALEAQGARVVMTREENDVDISNVERAQLLDAANVDLTLRLHCNGSENQSTHGVSLFVKSQGDGAEESLAIANTLIETMTAATGAHNAGVYQRDTYSGLNWAKAPTILVEMGFMSNPEEDERLCDPAYQALLVEGMVQGVADYFGRTLA